MKKSTIKIAGKTEIFVHDKSGKLKSHEIIPNTINNNLKYTIANHLADGTVNYGIDNLFTTNAAQGGAEDGNDGIVISDGNDGYTMITTLDSGGAGSSNQAVFKGVYTASGAYTGTNLYLGRALDWIDTATPYASSNEFASQTISKTLANGDQITVYWTITFS